MRLTDEELDALGAGDGIVVLPYLDALRDADPALPLDVVRRTAARGLLARGLVRRDEERWATSPGLLRVLAVRGAADLVAAGRRSSDDGTAELRYWHRRGRALLVEDLDGVGVHRFTSHRAEGLDRRIAAWLIPTTAFAARVATAAAPADPAVRDAVAAAVHSADLVVRRPDDGGAAPLLSVLSGPAGTAVLRSDAPAHPAGIDGTDAHPADDTATDLSSGAAEPTVQPVAGPAALIRLLAELLRP